MLVNLTLGLSTIVLCLLLQSLLLLIALRYYSQNKRLVNSPSFWASLAVIKSVMLLLVFGNLIQVAIWALLFILVGEFTQFNEAFYHSAVNFATLGYGDLVMSAEHKLLGPIEAINGALMIGISTAALMATFQDAMRKTIEARKHEHGPK
jgi:hypothetical protein